MKNKNRRALGTSRWSRMDGRCSQNRRDHSKEIAGGTDDGGGSPKLPTSFPSLLLFPLTAVGGAGLISIHPLLVVVSGSGGFGRDKERGMSKGVVCRRGRQGGREPGRTSTSSSSPSFRAGNPSVMRRWRSHWPSAYCHQTCTQLPCQGTDRETYHFPHCDRRTQR